MPTQFATDHWRWRSPRARSTKGFDEQLRDDERKFLYMPFQHSEKLDDQNRSVLLFTELGDEEQLGLRQEAPRRDRALRPLPAPQRDARSARRVAPTKRSAVGRLVEIRLVGRSRDRMRDRRRGSKPGMVELDACCWQHLRAIAPSSPLRERAGQRRARSRPAEREHLAVAGFAHRLLHCVDVGRPDAADDRHEVIGDASLCCGSLDLAGKRLARLLAVGPVVDDAR